MAKQRDFKSSSLAVASDIYDDFNPEEFGRVLDGIGNLVTEQEARYFNKAPEESEIHELGDRANKASSPFARKKNAYGNRIEPFLIAIARFAIVANTTLPCEHIIWGAIKMILTMSLSSREYFSKVIDLLESFGRNSRQLDTALRSVLTSPQVQRSFCSYYLVILDNCREILSILKEKESQNLKPRWKYLKMKSDTDQARLERFKIYLEAKSHLESEKLNAKDRECIALHRQEEIKYYVGQVPKGWDTLLELARDNSSLHEILRGALCIRISGYDCEPSLQRHSRDTSSRTTDWVTSMAKFLEWSSYESSNNSIWIYGSVGCGKSTLAAHVIKMLRSIYSDCAVVFFFCDPGVPESLHIETILRAMLQQLIRTTPNINHIYPIFDIPQKMDKTIEVIKQILEFRDLWGQKQSVYFIVDGMDHLSRADEGYLSKILEKIGWGRKMKLLITNQAGPAIHRPGINLDTIGQVDVDVVLYIETEIHLNLVHSRFRFNKQLVPTIKSAIIASSNGNFLLAKLHLALVLHAATEESLLEILERLPQTLISTYNLALNAIRSEGDKVKVKKIFNIVGVAPEPLKIEALSDYLDWDSRSGDLPAYSSSAILDVCKGLVVCEGSEDEIYVRFVHPTFKEYLLENKILDEPRAHLEVARTCLAYLHQSDFEHKVQHGKGKELKVSDEDSDASSEDLERFNGLPMVSSVSSPLSEVELRSRDELGLEHLRRTLSAAQSQPMMIEQFTKVHPFLPYAKAYWLYHTRTMDKSDQSWRPFKNLVMQKRKLLFDIIPWTTAPSGDQITVHSAKEYRKLANNWANQMKHFALSRLVVDWATRSSLSQHGPL
ncbi:hypothetical protein ABW19_dt0204855 [Dactylella cylindrospora]|nr:hypothetical protein ABW19_dt0204855 [Dactylella cylindrospora]